MTRQEEIRNAVDTIFPIPPSGKGRKYEQALMATGFEAGVKWADEHPKSPWISAGDDLPCNHKELLERNNETVLVIVKCKHFIDVDYMRLYGDGWIWVCHNDYDITRWMLIPEPPK